MLTLRVAGTAYDFEAKPHMTEKESPFACDMTAIAADQRSAHLTTINKLFRAVQSVRELPNGYSFRLRNETKLLLTVAEFIALERLCCPFFGFALEIEREGGAVWLSLTGREGVKPFIMAEIGHHLPTRTQG
jgi:hypothetical protein